MGSVVARMTSFITFLSARLVIFLLFSFGFVGVLGRPKAAAIGLALGSCRADLVDIFRAIEARRLGCPLPVTGCGASHSGLRSGQTVIESFVGRNAKPKGALRRVRR